MMKRSNLLFLGALSVIFLLQSCGVNSNLMFKQPKGEVNYDSIPMQPSQVYRISPDDKISFTLETNEGAKIIERLSGIGGAKQRTDKDVEYLVRPNGEVELPVLGKVNIKGLTVEECEDTLVALFSDQYKDPFVQVQVTNQRVIVFPGSGSDAKVIPLKHSNTSLMEALALAGGIADRGKAKVIKLIRKEGDQRKIYGIDLSTIEGLKYVDMIVQADDYIYVEPSPQIAREVVQDVVPVISLISSVAVLISLINVLK